MNTNNTNNKLINISPELLVYIYKYSSCRILRLLRLINKNINIPYYFGIRKTLHISDTVLIRKYNVYYFRESLIYNEKNCFAILLSSYNLWSTAFRDEQTKKYLLYHQFIIFELLNCWNASQFVVPSYYFRKSMRSTESVDYFVKSTYQVTKFFEIISKITGWEKLRDFSGLLDCKLNLFWVDEGKQFKITVVTDSNIFRGEFFKESIEFL